MSSTPDRVSFQGRFEVLRRLGAGGMGEVYAAYDHERNAQVALKVLKRFGGDALLRFKNEFRALQDLHHANLVSLGELFEEKGQWFFTMDLVEGTDFLTYVRPGADSPDGLGLRSRVTLGTRNTLPSSAFPLESPVDEPGGERPPPWRGDFDELRLRAALGQLAQGLAALHATGRVHRDIKPSNVLVTEEGRVVIVDFGLVTDVWRASANADVETVGTAVYMAPEQAASRPVGPEADWYSVGVVLYEALTGQLPFRGPSLRVLMDKQTCDPSPPRDHVAHVPADLNVLCVELLRRDAHQRLGGRALLERLNVEEETFAPSSTHAGSMPFVGRASELLQLKQAFADAQTGRAVTLLVRGESGLGKTALVQQFLEELAEDHREVVVLAGRCYEREVVPYKAVDGVVDALSRYLAALPVVEGARLVPRHATLLAQAFPVLRQVEAILRAPRPHSDAIDPVELRARVFAALRELVQALARSRPVVVVIDDLQWADADGLALLGELIRRPDAPPLLLVATVRPEADGSSKHDLGSVLQGDLRHLTLAKLDPVHAAELARLLVARANLESVTAASLASEAGGHPLFLAELVRHASTVGRAQGDALRLEDALGSRIAALPDRTQLLLELVCLAGTPLAQDLAARAADMSLHECAKQLGLLRTAHFVRTSGARRWDAVETFHDRVREVVVANLSEETRRRDHERLAVALETARQPDYDALYVHWRGAEENQKAAHFAALAAASAEDALAFERAAQLYRAALDLGHPSPAEALRLGTCLGDALTNVGRGKEAAAAYLQAARGADKANALDLQRRAAEELLHSGYLDDAFVELRSVLAAVSMPLPRTPRRALLSLLWWRALVRLRGLGFSRREPSQISPEALVRIDVCWRAATGLLPIDTIRGLDFQTRHLLLALRAGEPYRIARALAVEGGSVATGGGPRRRRVQALLKTATELAEQVAHPHARGVVLMSAGVADHLMGDWSSSIERCDRAEEIFRDSCRGVAWELGTSRRFALGSLYYAGRIAELGQRAPRHLRDALDRGDLYAATNVRTGRSNAAWLLADDVVGARREVLEGTKEWSRGGFHTQHFYAAQTLAQIDLYTGNGKAAWGRVAEVWPALKRSMLLRVQLIRIEAHCLRARAALAVAHVVTGSERESLVDEARRAARRLQRERMPWAKGLAALVLAGAAALRGDSQASLTWLGEAVPLFEEAGMALHAQVARWRQGQLLGGHQGDELMGAQEAWLVRERIKNASRVAAVLAPGLGVA